MTRYYIQYELNGIMRNKFFPTPEQAGSFGNYIRNIDGVTGVSRVLVAP